MTGERPAGPPAGSPLTDPLAVRGRRAPSRVIFGPHETNLCRGRAFSSRSVAYYARRAAGGAGLVVTEEASVHDGDWPYERAPLAALCGAGWSEIAAAVHGYDGLAVAALGHAGGQGSSAYTQRELWAPSAFPEVTTREVPKVMEPADIAEVVDGFAEATHLAVGAGMDGVEVNAGQHSLVRQFLSGLTNQRTDEYGQDRLRFAHEVLTAVRAAAGERLVGLRLCVDELAPWAGIVQEAAVGIASALAAYVDYLVVVRGSVYSGWATRPDGHVDPGFTVEAGRAIKAAVQVPVIVQGSIVDVALAERIVADGWCDAVEMTRAQLADPDLVAKLRTGEAERIRSCLLCNQACTVRDPRNPVVSCVVEPATGYETLEPAPSAGSARGTRRSVLVVGGGPAGLEAARVAALAGHRVRLVERADRLGGAVPLAACLPGRGRLLAVVEWLAGECQRLGVLVETGVQLGPDDLAATDERVIVATGARDAALPFPVQAGASVRTARRVLTDRLAGRDPLPPGPVVVWDPVGDPVGVGLAELLAATHPVTLATPDPVVGSQLARSGDLVPAQQRLHAAGVRLVRAVAVRRVGPDGLVGEGRFTGAPVLLPGSVVLVDPGGPDDALLGPGRLAAGDAVAPRSIEHAVREGRRAGRSIAGVLTR